MTESVEPKPLPAGTLMGERFEVIEVLGRGGFGIAYLAHDHLRRDHVVVKELAPGGTVRRSDGQLVLEALGDAVAHRLRRRFLEEAKLLGRLNLPAVPQIRASGSERGTAFLVTSYIADAISLDRVLAKEGRFSEAGALDIVFQLLEVLSAVHAKGLLHRDIKPSNVLLRSGGEVLLIDFGAAREWHADYSETQTVLYTPGYAPLEQFSERGHRGPATDLYGLCATAYTLLSGFAPPSAMDRVNGVALLSLRTLRPEMDPVGAAAIESGLALHYEERPATAEILRSRFDREAIDVGNSTLEAHDLRLLKLRSLTFGRRQCPGCGELMTEPKPLPLHGCPVCHKGRIRPRALSIKLCPACSAGTLRTLQNVDPLVVCPLCSVGVLEARRLGLMSKLRAYSCPDCQAEFKEQADGLIALTNSGEHGSVQVELGSVQEEQAKPWHEWGQIHPRSEVISICDGCAAQFDQEPDHQWRQVWPKPATGKPRKLYAEEWARVAQGLDPGAGTHVCDTCEADFFAEGERVTLLGALDDPFIFAEQHMGRLLTWEDLRWLGVGKLSPHPGLSCTHCLTEFDREAEYWRLIKTDHRPLQSWIETLHTWPDWHRLAQELPRIHEDASAEEGIRLAIVDAYRQGELDFDGKGTLWRGPGVRLTIDESGGPDKPLSSGTLLVKDGEITLGGLFKKERMLLEIVEQTSVDGDLLTVWLRGEPEPLLLKVAEIEMTVHLRSGDRTVTLAAADLSARLRHLHTNNF